MGAGGSKDSEKRNDKSRSLGFRLLLDASVTLARLSFPVHYDGKRCCSLRRRGRPQSPSIKTRQTHSSAVFASFFVSTVSAFSKSATTYLGCSTVLYLVLRYQLPARIRYAFAFSTSTVHTTHHSASTITSFTCSLAATVSRGVPARPLASGSQSRGGNSGMDRSRGSRTACRWRWFL